MIHISKYWIKRNEELLHLQLKKSEIWYKELTESYLSALKRVESELDTFYSSLDSITLAEAKKHLTGAELKEFKRNIGYYLTDNLRDEWKTELIKYQDRYRVSRFQAMQVQIRQELEILGKMELDGLQDLSWDIYTDNYYRELYEVTKTLGVAKVFDKIDTRKVELLNKAGWSNDGKNFSDRIWGRQETVSNFLNTELVQSIKLGEDPQTVINKMAKAFKTNKNDAGRLVMTESAYYASESQKQAYGELSVEQFQFIATLDDRTSNICQEMDLQIMKMSDYEVGVTAPPLHPFCRSTTIPYFDDNYTTRFSRLNDGNTMSVDKDISYSEWSKKYLK